MRGPGLVLLPGRGALHRPFKLLVTGDAALSLDQAHRDHALFTGLRVGLGLFALHAHAEPLLAIVEDRRAHLGLLGLPVIADIRRSLELFLTLRHSNHRLCVLLWFATSDQVLGSWDACTASRFFFSALSISSPATRPAGIFNASR